MPRPSRITHHASRFTTHDSPGFHQDRQHRHPLRFGGGIPASAARGAGREDQTYGRYRHRALDGRRHGQHGDLRPEALHRVRAGPQARPGAEHLPADRHGGGQHQAHRGPGEHRAGDGPRHADPLLHRGRSRLHPALAPSVPMAHRLRAAANGRRAAHRRGDRPDARPPGPGHAGLHRHRAAVRRGRGRGAEGLPHRRLSRQRVRAVHHRRSRGRAEERPPAGGHEPRPLRAARDLLPEAARAKPGRPARQRLPEGVAPALARQRASPAQFARGQGLRPVARAQGQLTTSTTRAGSASAVCWPGASPRPAPASSR